MSENWRHVGLFVGAIFVTACGGGDNGNGSGGSGGGGGTAAGGGGGSGGGSFTAATPPSDVCSLLTVADVQGVLAGAQPGVEEQTSDTSSLGFWSRICKYEGPTGAASLELVVFGALTPAGLQGIKLAAQTGKKTTPEPGLGDEAYYWESDQGTNGLWALKSPYSVDTTAYFMQPFPTAEQFKPLVVKALGQLP